MANNTHGGLRPGAGPKTKASKGLHKSKQLSITIPWELWVEMEDWRLPDEGASALFQRLLKEILLKGKR